MHQSLVNIGKVFKMSSLYKISIYIEFQHFPVHFIGKKSPFYV